MVMGSIQRQSRKRAELTGIGVVLAPGLGPV
jgi:hypothetical protein